MRFKNIVVSLVISTYSSTITKFKIVVTGNILTERANGRKSSSTYDGMMYLVVVWYKGVYNFTRIVGNVA